MSRRERPFKFWKNGKYWYFKISELKILSFILCDSLCRTIEYKQNDHHPFTDEKRPSLQVFLQEGHSLSISYNYT